jgi:hypothetical protein
MYQRIGIELFHQDYVPVHNFVLAMAAINKFAFELIENPTYLPGIAPSLRLIFKT